MSRTKKYNDKPMLVIDVSMHFDNKPHKLVRINNNTQKLTIWDSNGKVVERIDIKTEDGQKRYKQLTNKENKDR